MATAQATVGAPTRRRRRSGLSERRLAAAMLSPSLIVILLVAAWPIIYAIWLSLHQYSVRIAGLSRWSGLNNYGDALSSGDWRAALYHTLIFTVISVSLETAIGLGMALAMHAAFRGQGVLRTVVLVPWAILTVVTAVIWKTLLVAEQSFERLNAPELLAEVANGSEYVNGKPAKKSTQGKVPA